MKGFEKKNTGRSKGHPAFSTKKAGGDDVSKKIAGHLKKWLRVGRAVGQEFAEKGKIFVG